MNMSDEIFIMPAEYVGEAHIINGMLDVGGVLIQMGWEGFRPDNTMGVYVRRSSDDLSVMEVHLARHDGLAQEELDLENLEAQRYPLGAKEYWRSKMVGKYTYGADSHLMTNEDFEADWSDEDEEGDES